MLQRIQTLYLLAAALMVSSHFYTPMAFTTEESVNYTEFFPFVILAILGTAIAFFSIFLYRHRMAQVRLSIFNSIILVAYQAWILYFFFTKTEGTAFSITAVFPAIAAVLSFIAMRYILHDEAMVKFTSRLRSTGKNKKK